MYETSTENAELLPGSGRSNSCSEDTSTLEDPERKLRCRRCSKKGICSDNKSLVTGIVVSCLVLCGVVSAIIITQITAHSKIDDTLTVAVTVPSIMLHLDAFQGAANQTTPLHNRAVGLGYNLCAQYVLDELSVTNYYVYTQNFTVPIWIELSFSNLTQTTSDGGTVLLRPTRDVDFTSMIYGGNGTYDFIGKISNLTTSGCNVSEFVDQGCNGTVVLVAYEGGNCSVIAKAINAQDAGVLGILLYSKRIIPNRMLDIKTWQIGEDLLQVPLLWITDTMAQILWHGETFVHMQVSFDMVLTETFNIIAETRTGDPGTIIMQGSHLDSVRTSAGLNDNGSGSATNLEIALQYDRIGYKSPYKVRYAWWSAEEIGLLGSTFYVNQLNVSDINNIALYLNYDMIGSPNYVLMIHNASNAVLSRNASYALQLLYEKHFNYTNLDYMLVPLTASSDYYPFMNVGIPVGGLASGATGIKTFDQFTTYGGLANAPRDPCYHLPCDNINNINQKCLAEMSEAAATIWQQLAQMNNLRSFLGNTTKIAPKKCHGTFPCKTLSPDTV